MSHPSHIQEYQGIIDTLGHYIAGNRLASSEAMKPAFHEQATIYGLNGTEFFGPDIQQLYDDIDRFPASPICNPASPASISSATPPASVSTWITSMATGLPTSSIC